MSSVLPGFEYDIFISYRQKDNKGDGWVTEFVDALKTELEAAFKEDISVYFDINPHDGLLETHDVAESLNEKLKSLVFIPIVSRTYCDPNSYAWEHEFKAFIDLASHDQFGLKVKLPGGNIASRILPVQIHELDKEDKTMLEGELGGFLRSIEFIYKEPGVNKPLTTEEDQKKNLNNTKYGIQINKVANAIREIISGLKAKAFAPEKAVGQANGLSATFKKGELKKVRVKPAKVIKRKSLLWAAGISVLLLIAAIIAYPKVFNRNTFDSLKSADGRISVAVMPFQNLSNDTIWNIWQGGIQENLINNLSNSMELKVRQRESINNLLKAGGFSDYASIGLPVASKISQKLNANVFVYGSIKQAGDSIRVSAQLIDTKKEEIIKTFEINGYSSESNILTISDSLSRIVNNFLKISILKKEVYREYQDLGSSGSPEAYRYYIYGQNAFLKGDYSTARNMLSEALAKDSNFFSAAFMLCYAYGNPGMYDEAKKLCLQLYEKRDNMPLLMKICIDATYAKFFQTPYELIQHWKEALKIDDEAPSLHYNIGGDYNSLHLYDNAIPEFEKALEIYKNWECKPAWVFNYVQLGEAYHHTRQYKKELLLYPKAEKDFPDNPALVYRQSILSYTVGDTISANQYIKKYLSLLKDRFSTEDAIAISLGYLHAEADYPEKAEKYFRQGVSLNSNNPLWMNALAYFLIDQERNIAEGMEIVDNALLLSPDNYEFLDTKGWGLFKQGKYQAALDVLQRSWDLRMEKAVYNHKAWLHLEEAKKAAQN